MFKICPSCRDEFVQHVEVCPHCRVPLRTAEEMASAPEPADDDADNVLASAVVLRRGNPSDLRELCDLLTARGLRFAVDTDPPGRRLAAASRGATAPRSATSREVMLAIYVAEADAAAAAQVQREWLLATVPGAVDESVGGIDACPGCGEPLTANATACAGCGLEFPPLEVACPQCGQPVPLEAESCAGCGYHP